MEIGAVQPRMGEIRVAQIGVAQVRVGQVHARELGAESWNPASFCPASVSAATSANTSPDVLCRITIMATPLDCLTESDCRGLDTARKTNPP